MKKKAALLNTHEIQSEFQSLVHQLLCLAVVLVLILSPVCDDLLQLAVEGGEKTLPLLILALQTGQHQRQEWLLAQQRHAEEERATVKNGWIVLIAVDCQRY